MINNYTAQRIFEILHQIPLDIEASNVANIGIVPLEEHKEWLGEEGWQQAYIEAVEKNKNVIFNNITLEYDSCDCEYSCSCGEWIFAIHISQENEHYTIDIEDEHQLNVYLNGKTATIPMVNSSVYDFYRMCELVGINLEFSEYAKNLLNSN